MPLKGFLHEMMKATPSKSLVIKTNLVFLAFFFIVYLALVFKPSTFYQENASSIVSLFDRHMKKGEDGVTQRMVEETTPSFLDDIGRDTKIGLVNIEEHQWINVGVTQAVRFERVSQNLEWSDLFPEWIDEEEENNGPSCPEVPLPNFENYDDFEVVAARLPCRYPEEGWARDVFRFQIHMISANLAVKIGRRDGSGRVKVVFLSACRPMLELFRCDDLVQREGNWWLFEVDVDWLEQKMSLPIGSCNLALPLWEEGTNEEYRVSKIVTQKSAEKRKREAYATVLHSSDSYVCGAIALAQSIVKTGTDRDLVILVDKSISETKRQALISAGWKIRDIKRIRNPKAQKNSYNEYNYSKFRLWQLTDYDKVIFVDADIIVLRNLDLLFSFPQLSATGNDGMIFNSGIMAIEPSNCTFRYLMEQRKEIISYNGGDQGFLNEVFVWWHRLPRRINFLKNFWSNTSGETVVKNQLFGADPPKLYAIHFLGLKPWHCYRDYDCNWDIGDQHVYASDVAHRRWWKLHDSMGAGLQQFCGLSPQRKIELDWDRKKAGKMGFRDEHWRLNISDPRRHI